MIIRMADDGWIATCISRLDNLQDMGIRQARSGHAGKPTVQDYRVIDRLPVVCAGYPSHQITFQAIFIKQVN